MIFQQGDVLIEQIISLPKNILKKEGKTLAYGEVTGHHHTITKGDAELYEDNGILYLRVISDIAELTHQEHRILTIPKGDFIVKRVKEYSHFEEEAKEIKD